MVQGKKNEWFYALMILSRDSSPRQWSALSDVFLFFPFLVNMHDKSLKKDDIVSKQIWNCRDWSFSCQLLSKLINSSSLKVNFFFFSLAVWPILVNVICQDRLQGTSSNLAQTSTWTDKGQMTRPLCSRSVKLISYLFLYESKLRQNNLF